LFDQQLGLRRHDHAGYGRDRLTHVAAWLPSRTNRPGPHPWATCRSQPATHPDRRRMGVLPLQPDRDDSVHRVCSCAALPTTSRNEPTPQGRAERPQPVLLQRALTTRQQDSHSRPVDNWSAVLLVRPAWAFTWRCKSSGGGDGLTPSRWQLLHREVWWRGSRLANLGTEVYESHQACRLG